MDIITEKIANKLNIKIDDTNKNLSLIEIYQQIPFEIRKKAIDGLSSNELKAIYKSYFFLKRQNQTFPEHLKPNFFPNVWLMNAGRGFGKTQVLSWLINHKALNHERIIIVGATKGDLIDILVNGKSGIINSSNPFNRPVFVNGKLKWPNGAQADLLSAQEPDRARGRQSSFIAFDELASYPKIDDIYNMLSMGLRLKVKNGEPPQIAIATTPRPIKFLKDLIATSLIDENKVFLTTGSTFDNKRNLDQVFLEKMVDMFENTKLGRQELYAEVLDSNENALFTEDQINNNRITNFNLINNCKRLDVSFTRIVVAIDPAVSTNKNSNLTGIIVVAEGEDKEFYVLEDYSMVAKPESWASKALELYYRYNADLVVAETNQGGDLVESTLRNIDGNFNFKKVHATRGKLLRAEPISALYERNKVHHIGYFNSLERQMVDYTGDANQASPDRLDALVWGLTELTAIDNDGWTKFLRNHTK